MPGIVITIDGPAGSGKSTLAKQLADALHFPYLNTGSMYRALTLDVLDQGIDPESEESCVSIARDMDFEIKSKEDMTFLTLNGDPLSEEIKSERVDKNVSITSRHPLVRDIMVEKQRMLGEKGSIIVEGRDAGTRVFTGAQAKIYVTASVDERARRRFQEYVSKGMDGITQEMIKEDIQKRDLLDSTRECSPLKIAHNALILDTTGLTKDSQLEKVLSVLREKGLVQDKV